MGDKLKVQFEFSEKSLARLEDMVKRSGLSSKGDVIREGLKYYDWMLSVASYKRITIDELYKDLEEFLKGKRR